MFLSELIRNWNVIEKPEVRTAEIVGTNVVDNSSELGQ